MADDSGSGKYLGDAVYGALDGIITTFAVVAGVVGASLSTNIIIILGIANLLADGVSMAAGNYLSKRSDQGYRERRREDELIDIKKNPKEHKEEVRKIYRNKGFSGKILEQIVATITKDKERWADETMIGEHGVFQEDISPVRSAWVTFVSFVVAGAVPLLAYVLALGNTSINTFSLAVTLTLITLFVVGSLRSVLTNKGWLRAGLEMLIVGGVAATIAYLVGYALRIII